MVNDRAQRDWERYNERLVIPSAFRNGTGTGATLNASIQNVGAVSAHLVTLFLSAYDSSNSPRLQLQYAISMWIGSGTTKYNFGQDKYGPRAYNLTSPGVVQPLSTVALPDDSLTYVVKVVTERGNIVIETIREAQTQLPQLMIVPGTMEISYNVGNTVWDRPRVTYGNLKNSVEQKSPDMYGYFLVRAKFINNGNEAMRVRTGSILFQYCFAAQNNKVLGFGGRLYKCGNIEVDLPSPYGTEVVWSPREEVTLVFRCGIYVWAESDLRNMFSEESVPPILEVAWLGSASISSRVSTNPMTTAAIVIDGLLVTYKTWT
jgi:hypothetical protein